MPFTFDPDVARGVAAMSSNGPRPSLPVGESSIPTRRQQMEAGITSMLANFPDCPDVQSTDFHTKSHDGHSVLLRWYSRRDRIDPSTPGPAILHMHGGGVFALSVDVCNRLPRIYVQNTGVPVLSVDYRLAPEVRAQVPTLDCFAGLQYLVDHASELGVDPARIAVMGESGGGYLAASLTYHAKAVGGPKISKQLLIYPMLDDRPLVVEENLAPFLVVDVPGDNATGWQALLGDKAGGPDVPTVHAPGRMTIEEAGDLPPAYVEVGQLDPLREGCLDYVRKLGKAGVDVTFHLWASAPHVFEFMAPEGELTRLAMGERFRTIMCL